jgi:site-specific recombinase XerD
MDRPAQSPLIRSFERHLRSENRSERTIATYLAALRQADAFLRARTTTVEAATRADLEAFMGDLLARRAASTAATYFKVWTSPREADTGVMRPGLMVAGC